MRICPKCKNKYNNQPAISRADNKTELCSLCGTVEALVNCLFPKVELKPNEQHEIEKDLRAKIYAGMKKKYGSHISKSRELAKSSRKVAENSQKGAE